VKPAGLILLVSTLALLFAGCLVSEVTEYKITLNPDGKSGTFTTIMRNVESDSPDSATQRRDFQSLMDRWKGNQYLFDEMEKGMYVKERSLRLEKGKLVWRETAIFADLSKLIPEFSPDKPLTFPLADTTGQKVKTNGTLTTVQDSILIMWPPHARKYELKTVQRSFTPGSNFAKLFKARSK
jgi:hypothetical protein